MHAFTRRHFIKTTLAGASLMSTAPHWLPAAEPAATSFKGSDIVSLGNTGIKVSRLAQGTGYNGYNRSSAQTRAGKESFDRLVRHGLDEGITFLDMADLYGSHPFVKDVLKGLNREKFVLLTKIWPRKEKWVTPSGNAREEMDRFRKELDTDVIDVCLLHCMLNDKWPTEYEGIRDGLSELKQKKIVRAVGVSCHDFAALKASASHPWVDVIFARINHKGGKDYSCDASVEEVSDVLKTARKNGKSVVGMKIFGAGKLVKPEEKAASLDYVFRQNLVDAITVGMCKTEEVDDTLKHMSQVARG